MRQPPDLEQAKGIPQLAAAVEVDALGSEQPCLKAHKASQGDAPTPGRTAGMSLGL